MVETGQSKKRSLKHNIVKYFSEYCNRTSIHGVQYIGETRRIFIEKIWWLTSITVALYFCTTLIANTYRKWENSPVIVSFATRETPIWQIPFPAVTICPETKTVTDLYNYTDMLYRKLDDEILSRENELKLSYLAAVCTNHYEINYSHNLSKFIESEEIFDFFNENSPKFLQDISDCYYMGDLYNCTDLFTPIITDEGLCYTFNLLDRKDILSDKVIHYKNYHSSNTSSSWSLEHGYINEAGKNTYPKRALYAGALFALELKLKTLQQNLDFTCGSSIQGYKIQIHHPSMLPRVKQQHFRIPLDQAVIAAMMPTMMTTSEAVKSYKPERRECFFPSERSLRYFKVYTQQNCQIECKTNYTQLACGCVDFYMPRDIDDGMKICGAPLKKCMLKAEDDLLSEGIETKLRSLKGEATPNGGAHEIVKKCNCMPECNSMSYIVENSQSDWDWVSKFKFDRNSTSFNKSTTHMSYLQVFFKGNQFITSQRNELYGPTDFLANFGGLLGLFTGFSILSLIEILYFITLRIACNMKLFGIKYWAGKNE